MPSVWDEVLLRTEPVSIYYVAEEIRDAKTLDVIIVSWVTHLPYRFCDLVEVEVMKGISNSENPLEVF